MKKLLFVIIVLMATFSISYTVFADDMEMLQRIGDKAYYRDTNGINHTISLFDFNSDGEINMIDALFGVQQLKDDLTLAQPRQEYYEVETTDCEIASTNYRFKLYNEKGDYYMHMIEPIDLRKAKEAADASSPEWTTYNYVYDRGQDEAVELEIRFDPRRGDMYDIHAKLTVVYN